MARPRVERELCLNAWLHEELRADAHPVLRACCNFRSRREVMQRVRQYSFGVEEKRTLERNHSPTPSQTENSLLDTFCSDELVADAYHVLRVRWAVQAKFVPRLRKSQIKILASLKQKKLLWQTP
jgi:hypothetical protein